MRIPPGFDMRKEKFRLLRNAMNDPNDPFVKHPNWRKNAEFLIGFYESDAPIETDILLVSGVQVDEFPKNKKAEDVFWHERVQGLKSGRLGVF
jgi:hypothetical protein